MVKSGFFGGYSCEWCNAKFDSKEKAWDHELDCEMSPSNLQKEARKLTGNSWEKMETLDLDEDYYAKKAIEMEQKSDYKLAIELYENAALPDEVIRVTKLIGDDKVKHLDYDKAIELDPNFYPAYLARGAVHFILQDFTSSLNDFNKTVDLTQALIEASIKRGNVKTILEDSFLCGFESTHAMCMHTTCISSRIKLPQAIEQQSRRRALAAWRWIERWAALSRARGGVPGRCRRQ